MTTNTQFTLPVQDSDRLARTLAPPDRPEAPVESRWGERPREPLPKTVAHRGKLGIRIGTAFVLVLLYASGSVASSSTWVRISLNPSDQAYVGQYVRVDVDIMSPEIIPTSPVLDLPAIDGGVMLQQSAFSTRGSEVIDGVSWQMSRYALALFPHRAGPCDVPPVHVRFPPEAGVESPLLTDPVRVRAVMPPGAEGLRTLVSTPSLDVSESWTPEPGPATVGDAFRRTITLTATSVLGMGFPPLTIEPIDGLGVYPGDPDVRDQSDRGRFTGSRIESVTYVCERAGTFTIPGVEIPWFDMKAGTLRYIELPDRTIEVAPNPALVSADGSASVQRRGTWGRWMCFFAAAVSAGTLYHYRACIGASLQAWRRRRYESEPATFRRLLRAARHGTPAETVNAWLLWLDRASPGPEPTTMGAFVSTTEDRELAVMGNELLDAVYGPESALLDGAWDGGVHLSRTLSRARKRMTHASTLRSRSGAQSLVPLNYTSSQY